MVEELRLVIERAQRQPEDVQRRLAEILREALDQDVADEWEATPAERAAIEASRAEYAAGDYRDFDDYDRERAKRERV